MYNGFKIRGMYSMGRKRSKDCSLDKLTNQYKDNLDGDDDELDENNEELGLYSISRALNIKISNLGRKATVMIIGNVSAGKSTLINWLLQENVQKTGMAIETCGISFVVSGKQINEIGGETALMILPDLREIVERNPSLLTSLTVKTFPSSQGRLQSINFIDTPGLVDGDSIYSFDIDNVIKDLAISLCDLVLICVDPSGQALSKRLLSLAKYLAENTPHKTNFLLTKIDEIPTEEDRIKVMCQVTQNLSSSIIIKHGFDLIPIYVAGAKDGTYLALKTLQPSGELLSNSENQNTSNVRAKSSKSQASDKSSQIGHGLPTLNRIMEVVNQIEKVVERKVQDDIATLLNDCQTLIEYNKSLIYKQTQLEKNMENLSKQKNIYKKSSVFILILILIMAIFQLCNYTGFSLLSNNEDIHNSTISFDLSPENLTSIWLFLTASLLASLLLYKNVQKEQQKYSHKGLKSLKKYLSILSSINSKAIDLHNSYINF